MTRHVRKTGAGVCAVVTMLATGAPSVAWAQQSWVERAVHNFGEPINTLWAEGDTSVPCRAAG